MTKEAVKTNRTAPPVGPYSAAIRSGDLLYVSGQIALDPTSGKLIEGDIAREAEQVFSNLRAVLDAAGKSFADAIRVGVFLVDMKDFATVNDVYARHFREPYPARTTVAVAGLPLGAKVEIELVARS